jgi:protein TonB
MKAASWPAPTEPDLPKFGEYVYVEELAKPITKVQPEYPDIARMMGVEGSVVVYVLVGKDGRVKDARIVKSVEPMLNRAAERAVREWIFKPALTGNKPMAMWMAVPVYVGPPKAVRIGTNR